LIVTRHFATPLLFTVLLTAVPAHAVFARQATPAQKPAPNPPDEANPPEEDESLLPEKVPLNPMEAERSIKVGVFYMHKGKYRAAKQRFTLATKYNPSSPDAYFRLGEAEEKLKDTDAAKAAFEKVVKLAPNTKLAEEAHKKLEKKG
jgi:tetratricopeptide (TPR) repeat protein